MLTGAGVIAEHNQELADTLNARTFALAQQVEARDLMMNICSTCQGAQTECQERLDANAEYRAHVNETLRRGGPRVREGRSSTRTSSGCWSRRSGSTSCARRVKRPLTDLRVGPFYGCYIVRPTDRLGIDDDNPRDTYLGQVIEALGGTVIDYAGAHKCCGFPIITMNKEASLKQAGRHLGDAVDADADCLVTPCPLCHLNLDLQQPLAERKVGPRAEHAGPAPAQLVGSPWAFAQSSGSAPRRQADVGDRLDQSVIAGASRGSAGEASRTARSTARAEGTGRRVAGARRSSAAATVRRCAARLKHGPTRR